MMIFLDMNNFLLQRTYRFMGWLSRWLHFSTSLKITQLLSANFENGVYSWQGENSQILMEPKHSTKLHGFYMMELSYMQLQKGCNSRLYSNSGDGFSVAESAVLPMLSTGGAKKTVKRICYFSGYTNTFRWDPSNTSGMCQDIDIKLVRLSDVKARSLMQKKLQAFSVGSSDVDEGLSSLYEAYDNVFITQSETYNYEGWITRHGNSFVKPCELPKNSVLVSIIVPTFNTKPQWLDDCIASVIKQTYTNWELIVVDDASTDLQTKKALGELSKVDDARIQTIFNENNGHICVSTNIGIDAANGDYVTFLDHDDELHPDALAELVSAIDINPKLQLIYTDEDLMSESGERITPHFKSDWNPDLLLSHNYITHLACYSHPLLMSLNGMREGYEGAQDYDLALRALSVLATEDILHIPRALYHWRMVEGSTAQNCDAKSYATEAGLRAVQDYLQREKFSASAIHDVRSNFYRVQWDLPRLHPKVAIIIPTRDGLEVLKPCIETLLEKTAYDNYEIIIVDNGSIETATLKYFDVIKQDARIKIIRDDGIFNYSRINNVGAAASDAPYLCLLNNDIEIIDEYWLSELVSLGVRDDVGCVGAKLLYPDGSLQHGGVILGLGGYAAHSHRGIAGDDPGYFNRAQIRQQLLAVTGACLLVKRCVFDEVSGLDEAFAVAYNDVDFCLRVHERGYKNIYTPYASLVHYESKTRGEDNSTVKIQRLDKEKELLLSRWGKYIENDPFYNPNLTRSNEHFSLRVRR